MTRTLAVLCLSCWLASCDQTVIAVGPGSGGAGGHGGTANGGAPNGGQAGLGGNGGACGTPTPVLPIEFCGGSVSASTGMLMQCATCNGDANGHQWEALCTVEGCSCIFDNVEVCTCVNDPPTAICDSVDNCCPGWPK
jgi:hypothetical protein